MRYKIIPLLLLTLFLTTPAFARKPTPMRVPLYDNLGTHHHQITTKSPQAQRYFDQGLRLTYGFNHDEAIAAFKEGARLDPDCAMCYWGAALAMGPNINLPMDLKTEPAANELAQKAVALAPKVSEAERAYIDALSKRYTAEPGESRAARDQAYADAMREVAKRNPNDTDAATLFAEALMDLQPWDYWTHEGRPKGNTEEVVATLESVLKKNPDHPGACHYYIHAVEASMAPQRALPCAKRLPSLMPGAGHLVHMPAHTYIRVGMYKEAEEANVHAVHTDERYIEDRKVQGFYALAYYPHNLHFLYAAAAMAGRSEVAIKTARELVGKVPDDMVKEIPPLEMFKPTVYFALARFGKWEEILKEPVPAAEFKYTTGIWRYARGRALLATGKAEEAKAELDAITKLGDEIPADLMINLNSGKSLLQIASKVLAGEIAAQEGRSDEAIQSLSQAAEIEDRLVYDEPPPWYQPVRQNLGAVLLAAKRPAEAEKVYRDDLKRNPENGWSLYGLTESLQAQGKKKEAAAEEKRFQKAWKRADIKLAASRF
ncbi:MAG: tetratricopeptide repeat protein [Candidatus Manganitrophaceae bacterium]|nr:MAG: tetratricopeptide repeat protein [Candidatus Manganitrophaceae bacterium]